MNHPLPPELQGQKASVVFMEYVEPFLKQLILDRAQHGISELPSTQAIENILRLPWCIWNAIVAETIPDQKIDSLASMDRLVKNMPASIKDLLDFMKKRKRNEFGQYQYYLGAYKVYYGQNQNDLRISVESRLPPSP